MKRVLCLLAALALLVCALYVPALAEDDTEHFVYDVADVLTDSDMIALNDAAKEVSLRNGCGVYVVVFEDIQEYGYDDLEDFAENLREQWDLGLGDERKCVAVVFNLEEAVFQFVVHGADVRAAFTQEWDSALTDEIIRDYTQGGWTDCFSGFIAQCDRMLSGTGAPAAQPENKAETASGSYVFDLAGLLSDSDVAALERAAAEVSERHGCGVYVAVFSDMSDYGYSYIEDFSEAVVKQWGLGIGPEHTTILLVMSMAERDYDICAFGDKAHYAFTDYGKNELAGEFKDNFRNDDWAGGFADYIRTCDEMLSAAEAGNPVDVPPPPPPLTYGQRLGKAAIPGVIVGIIIALILASIQKGKMKSARIATRADEYVAGQGARMLSEQDTYSHSTVTRQRIERDSGSRSGGTHVNSSGHSHSSGKF